MRQSKRDKPDKPDPKGESRRQAEVQKWLKKIDADIVRATKLMIKPLPLRWRIPAVFVGVSIFSLGGLNTTYWLANSFLLFNGKWQLVFTPLSFAGAFLGFVGIIAGFMIIHKALQGMWV